ncbi:DsbC family protein [Candidatus Nitrosacidococcus tergens]|uniref:Thiol:disulfide interchange protein n=1 Tax=Candidatus Nitrosacidococcus tergens TaxID=553981 RepID=A0A7G1Q8Q0_9GAMM|nr:DsbC family protein [Candidatus Nitrosacidococcus tergens]CAB1275175.1 Thiol-disulfide interchange protein DsbC [Candidatus Nitrosacidococcus tergens]
MYLIFNSIFLSILITFSSLGIADEQQENSIKESLKRWAPDAKPQSIKSISVPNLYEVILDGQIFYLTQDGRYAIQGQIIDLATRTNLTEKRVKAIRAAAISELDEKDMIVFTPKDPKYTVNIFTDIDCPYCRQMHQHIDEYNKLGIKVRYLAFPRAGIGSSSYDKAANVWCAQDKQKAITLAKADKPIKNTAQCTNPVADQFLLGEKIGVNATPTFILKDGTMIPGFIRPSSLIKLLEQNANSAG